MYIRGTRISRLLGVKDYLNNYFAMYKRLTSSHIYVELASLTYLGLGIFEIIMYTRLTTSRIRVEVASPAYTIFIHFN